MSPVLTQRWQVVTRVRGGFILPVKNGLNGAIPAPIIKSVGSFSGISDALGKRKCPHFCTKKSMYAFLNSLPVMYFKVSTSNGMFIYFCYFILKIVSL